MADKISKKFGLLFTSLFIAIILSLVLAEAIFFVTHGAWYRNKSYLLYRSRFQKGEMAKLAEDIFYSKDKLHTFPNEYKPVILKNIPGGFDISLLQMRINYDDRWGGDYDLVVSFWARCARPERVRFFLQSNTNPQKEKGFFQSNAIKNSFLADKKVEESGCYFFLASIPFRGDVEGWVENGGQIAGCKDLKIFLKRHPFVYHYKEAENSYRIIVIGGSTSACYGLHPWETYSFFLQKYFDALYPGRVDVINLALPGGVLNDFLENLEYYISFKPDMLIIAPVWNDINSATIEKFILNKAFFGKATYYDALEYIRENRFFSNYALGYYLYSLFNIKLTKEAAILNDEFQKLGLGGQINKNLDTVKYAKDQYWDVIKKRLDSLIEAFNKQKVKIVLVTLPSLSTGTEPTAEEKKDLIKTVDIGGDAEAFFRNLGLLDYFESIDKEIIQEVAQKRGAILVRCQDDPWFRNSPYSVRKFFFGDHAHFNPCGSDLIGTIIASRIYKIVEEGLREAR